MFQRNRLGTDSVIPQKKVLIPGHSEVQEESIPKLERNGIKRKMFYVYVLQNSQNNLHRIESVFSSAKCFGTKFRKLASFFVPRNKIPSCFLFRGIVWNGVPRVWFFFVPRYKIPSIFFFREIVWNGIPRVSLLRNSRNSVGTNCFVYSVYSVYGGIIFSSEIPNPTLRHVHIQTQPSLPSTSPQIQSSDTHTQVHILINGGSSRTTSLRLVLFLGGWGGGGVILFGMNPLTSAAEWWPSTDDI